MKREIKFRGMDANNVMRYGRMSQDKPNTTLYFAEYSQRICWDDSNIPVSNATLGQFTGLLDSKGTEIYEGDVVLYSDGEKREVGFKDGMFGAGVNFNFYPLYGDVEIIGNVHENPELIKPL